MALIKLSIEEPKHNNSINGMPANVTFRGKVCVPQERLAAELYYRWYSSSVVRLSSSDPPIAKGYSMNPAPISDPAVPFEYELGLGSHVITFAVSDQPGESNQDFENIQHAGITGGSSGDSACVIHVYAAKIVGFSSGKTIPKTNLRLSAEAPAEWEAKYLDAETNQYIFPYQQINQLAYHWKLEPLGNPPGRSIHESGQLDHGNKLSFSQDTGKPIVTYQPDLSSASENDFEGLYRVTLSVLNKKSGAPVDSARVEVFLTH